jgi:nitrite reductase/ring-hydroxylating ferredoxin subunit
LDNFLDIKSNQVAANGMSVGTSNPDWHRVADNGALEEQSEGRLHLKHQGRYISIIRYKDRLYCVDSVCFHAGGPLALGDVEELQEGNPCLICPWHFYHISIKDGEKWYQAAQPGVDGKLEAGNWKSIGKRQRVHEVEERDDGIYVKLCLDGNVASDDYAFKQECGARVKAGPLRTVGTGFGMGERDGTRSPNRPASPLRATPPASPRGAIYMEGEDVWPEDLVPEACLKGNAAKRQSS